MKSPAANKKAHPAKPIYVEIAGETKQVFPRPSDGRYEVRIRKGVKGYDSNGRPIYDYKHLYADGEMSLRLKIKQFEESSALTKEEFIPDLKNWLKKTYYNSSIKPTSYDRMEQIINNQIAPAVYDRLHHTKVTEITVEDCQEILSYIRDKGYKGSSTYKKCYTLLKSYFEDKFDAGVILKNPMKFKQRGNVLNSQNSVVSDDEKPVFLNKEEIARLKNVIYNGYEFSGKSRTGKEYANHMKIPQGEFFIFMLNTGIRAGEAVALKYSDIDLEQGLMTIRSNAIYVDKRNEFGDRIGGRERLDVSPKTPASMNTIRINKLAVQTIKSMKENEPKDYTGYILHEVRKKKDSDEFTPLACISTHALYQRFQTLCKYADVVPRGVHCLRHTFASELFAASKGNAVIVSEMLRHTDVAFTERLYIDIIKEYREQILMDFEV